jgi:hypothetical protein
MAKFKITRSALFTAGICDEIQSLTGASTATAITNHGVTKITIASGTESATVAQLVYYEDGADSHQFVGLHVFRFDEERARLFDSD